MRFRLSNPLLFAALFWLGTVSVSALAQEPESASTCVTGYLTNPGSAIKAFDASPSLPEAPMPEFPPSTISVAPLTVGEKLTLGAHRAFGPPSFLLPMLQAGGAMAKPPTKYPTDWHDGAVGFGRLYGDFFVRNTSNYAAQYITAAIDREDPRYFPSHSPNPFKRLFHAVVFTLVDRADSGRRTLALSNIAGSLAGGFVTMAYQPNGFNDITHADQRASINLGVFAALNVASEFGPGLAHLLHFQHVSNVPETSSQVADESFPVWWAIGSHTTNP